MGHVVRNATNAAMAIFVCALATGCGTAVVQPAIPPTTVAVVAPQPEPERVVLPARERFVAAAPDPVPAPSPVMRVAVLPAAADDATALAQQLVSAERAVRDQNVVGDELAYMGHLQQLAYLKLIQRPELRAAVFDAIPADVRAAADFNLAAGADLWVFGHLRPTTLPAWRIVQPAPVEELMRYYREAESQFGVPWYYLAAINLVETRMGRIRGDSYAGAQGPMQFMPATWDYYGQGDINDPHDAILGAGRYLRASGAPAKMDRAIWAYNHDNAYVDAVKKYAEVMRADPSAYRGYYGWQVYFQTQNGTILLPVGYSKN